MKKIQTIINAAVLGISGVMCSGVVAAAEPVELVVTYSAGGVSDLMGRNLAIYMESGLERKMIVQNRPGAAGVIGTDVVYKAKPNGNTVLLARIATLAVAPTLQKVPYDPTGFTPLGLIATDPFACITSTRKNIKDPSALKELLTERPGTVTYSSSGVGSLNQFAALRLLEELGIENPIRAAVHIPAQGEGPALTSVAGGHIDFFCGNLAPILPQIQSGTVRALFVTSSKRLADLPDTPTARELDLPGMEDIVGWSALMGPPQMSAEQITLFVDTLAQVKENKEWQSFIYKVGSEPAILSPAETTIFIQEQQKIYNDMATRIGLKK